MSKEFDTSWFDLKNYATFETMSLESWHHHLLWRRNLEAFFPHRDKIKSDKQILRIKENPAQQGNHCYKRQIGSNSFSTPSINNLNSADMMFFRSTEDEFYPIWASCEDNLNNDVPFDFLLKEQFPSFSRLSFVQINLSASDEQLKNDFDHWLKNYRKETGITSNKKYFSQSDLDKWFKFCAIPYLDLLLIAKIEDKKITQHRLSSLIFPNEFDVDVVGRLRDTTKPMAEMLKNHDTHNLISLQVTNEKSRTENTTKSS